MRTLDPSIRQAAQRVTAWHIARWQAHIEATDTQSPETETSPVDDPKAPQQTAPVHEPSHTAARTPPKKAGRAS